MIFVTSNFIEQELMTKSVRQVLQEHGRKRIAPGFTVADYVKIGEFYKGAAKLLRSLHPEFGIV